MAFEMNCIVAMLAARIEPLSWAALPHPYQPAPTDHVMTHDGSDDLNQIEIPESFMALYCRNGRPIATRVTIEDRYDLCEDLALQTSEACQTIMANEELPEELILARCGVGLLADDLVTTAEADWIVSRVAELLSWSAPARNAA
jgi:hypothetical protein